MSEKHPWLTIHRGEAPLIVSIPHSGTEIPETIERDLISPWLARKDADWWVERLYDFAPDLDATIVRTAISRTVIDVNRDPSGKSLYPGQATTELCPTTTFDGEPLYKKGVNPPDATQIVARRLHYFDPYHEALADEIARLRSIHERVVLFEAHSIRSAIPRLFESVLPNFNIGTNSGASCAPELAQTVEAVCNASRFTWVTNGRFKGGWTTRHYGEPQMGVHAIQMELACRGYMDDPPKVSEMNWPAPYDENRAGEMRKYLFAILQGCIRFADTGHAYGAAPALTPEPVHSR
ncbi:MAG TPA: N-formylglutamate deformylase [Rhizomicrobium sp.]|nr:N-formylglutamate deformylase [Rhizomicrobium sp.]